MHKAISFLLLCLLLVAVFDPADKIAHMKVPLFAAVWALTAVNYCLHRCPSTLPLSLLIYVIGFSFLIPLWSICWYFSQNGALDGYDGFNYLKGYLFLTLCIPLALEKIDLVPVLSLILTVQAALASFIYTITLNNPIVSASIYGFGSEYGVFSKQNRTYGEIHILQPYFVTSPLLAISISYFTFKCIVSKGWKRVLYLLLLILNVVGMLRSGTRNNMIASVATLLLVWLWYSRRKVVLACSIVLLVAAVASMQWSTIHAMLDTEESSNAVKIQFFRDYTNLLSDPTTLLLGQGLGAAFNSTERGYVTVSELTYMELLRSYGVMFGVPMLVGLFYPLERLARHKWKPVHFLYLAYAVYLYLCTANPLLVSSSGMLVFSIVLTMTFSYYPVEQNSIEEVGAKALSCVTAGQKMPAAL
jgi:hypothetical protein